MIWDVQTAAVIDQQRQNQGSRLRKGVVFGVYIGLGAGGVVVARGWVFTVVVAAAVFAAAREYVELVRSRGPPKCVEGLLGYQCPHAHTDAGLCNDIFSSEKALGADSIYLEGDSTMVTDWIQGQHSHVDRHPLLRNICRLLKEFGFFRATYVYREVNNAADWAACCAAHRSEEFL